MCVDLYMCILFLVWCVWSWVFLRVFPQWGFFPLFFPLVDVGQHPPKFVLCLDAPTLLLYIVRCNDFVWRAQQASLPHNSYCMVVHVLYLVKCMLGACSGSAVTINR